MNPDKSKIEVVLLSEDFKSHQHQANIKLEQQTDQSLAPENGMLFQKKD